MTIKAILDRIENGNAILLSEDVGMEISIPVEMMDKDYTEGEEVTLTFKD